MLYFIQIPQTKLYTYYCFPYYLTEILKHIRQLCFCASSAVLSLSTDVGNNYELLSSVNSSHFTNVKRSPTNWSQVEHSNYSVQACWKL